ncbi:hypothetical protein IFM89_010023 [Coptis chinensis]|uniref:Uncharacterized protein n=1 Tax=Coptis chinensis TaxID=261450 RepID=A0A835HLK9_9MAGN|nr:hypothetical protein IFM89_010023 [Coptis chinensis]
MLRSQLQRKKAKDNLSLGIRFTPSPSEVGFHHKQQGLFSSPTSPVCAEYLGQKVGFGPYTQFKKEVKNMESRQNESGTSNSTPSAQVSNKVPQKNQSMKPRFALELDGLNCFETVVSH